MSAEEKYDDLETTETGGRIDMLRTSASEVMARSIWAAEYEKGMGEPARLSFWPQHVHDPDAYRIKAAQVLEVFGPAEIAWREVEEQWEGRAPNRMGEYSISSWGPEAYSLHTVFDDEADVYEFPTLEEAQEAAQLDYERRHWAGTGLRDELGLAPAHANEEIIKCP